MTDINKAISEVVELAMSKTILAFGDDDVSQIEPIKAETIAKIKALVVDSLPPPADAAEIFDYKKKYGITVGEAIKEQDIYNGCLGEIRSIYEA